MWRKFMLVTVVGVALLPVMANRGDAQSLQVGDHVPEFQVKDDQGKIWKSRDHVGQRVLILFFYPSDFSFCCTRQAERYRDSQRDLAMLDAEVVGISCDSSESHQMFKTAHALNYALLADWDGNIARTFGVPLRAGGKAMAHDAEGRAVTNPQGEVLQFSRHWTVSRWTFVIGKNGRVLRRDMSVSPIGDSKAIADFVCNLTAN